MSTGTIDSMQHAHGVDVSMSRDSHNEQRQQAGTTTDPEPYVPTKRDEKIIIATLIGLLVYELLGLFGWLHIAGLAGMAFDTGFSWGVALLVGPIFLYPVFILVCWLIVPILVVRNRHWGAVTLAIAPPVLAFAPMVLNILSHRFVSWVGALF